jgi:hypothetical protein
MLIERVGSNSHKRNISGESGKKPNPQRLPLECRARALVHAAIFVRGPDCPDDVSVMLKRTSIAAGPRLRTNSLVPHSINDTT